MEQERPCALDLQLADQLGGLQLEGLAAPSQDENAWAAAAAAADVTPLPRARRRRAGGQPYTPLHMAATAAGGEAAVTPALMAVAPSTTPCTAGWATGQKPLTQAQRSLRNSVLKGCMGEVVEEAAAAEETPSAKELMNDAASRAAAQSNFSFGKDTMQSYIAMGQKPSRMLKAKKLNTQLAENGSISSKNVLTDKVGKAAPGSTAAMNDFANRRHQASRLTKHQPSRLGGN